VRRTLALGVAIVFKVLEEEPPRTRGMFVVDRAPGESQREAHQSYGLLVLGRT
jgi:hypothetical protein